MPGFASFHLYIWWMTTHGLETTIILPCRNESGNLTPLVEKLVPFLRENDNLVIVEGGSSDNTWSDAIALQSRHPSKIQIFQQDSVGKFDAVLKGIENCNRPVVMIWDTDATVNFEQNLAIYLRDSSDKVLVTGDRLRGTRDKGAMPFANLVGNWLFATFWVFIHKQKPFDLLCGTKKFPRVILDDLPTWMRKKDPFGDFVVIALAKKGGLKIESVPVLYHARSHGKTNIHRWQSGVDLLKLSIAILLRK